MASCRCEILYLYKNRIINRFYLLFCEKFSKYFNGRMNTLSHFIRYNMSNMLHIKNYKIYRKLLIFDDFIL